MRSIMQIRMLGLGMVDMLDWDMHQYGMNPAYMTLYKCVILYMLGVVYSNVEFSLVSYDEV